MAYIIVGAFILLDLVTGIIKAFKEKNYCSSIMREGLLHKCASVACVLFGWLVDFAQGYLDLGVSFPMGVAVCVYICLMEIGSIIENLCMINPKILPDKLKSFFAKLNK